MKETMTRGWIKLHRKLRESAIYNEGLVFLLIECLFSATHKEIKIDYAGVETTLHAGQFVFGRHQWAKRLKINESTLYKRITKLNKYGIISVANRNSSSGTIYQIEKWNEYQQEEQLSNSSVTAKEQLGNTNKNVKNDKNEKNNNIALRENFFLSLEDKSSDYVISIANKFEIKPNEVMGLSIECAEHCRKKNIFKESKDEWDRYFFSWVNRAVNQYKKFRPLSEREADKNKPKLSEEDKWIIENVKII